MSKIINKYLYLLVLQGYYEPYGWEDLTAEDYHDPGSWKRIRADHKAYRENEGGRYRIIKRREPNPNYPG